MKKNKYNKLKILSIKEVLEIDGGYIRDFIRILGRKRILKANEKNGIYL